MTGRDLIIYILQNHLEDEDIFKDGKCMCFMTEEEVAVLFGVGLETVKIMDRLELIRGIKIGGKTFYPRNLQDPRVHFPKAGDDEL